MTRWFAWVIALVVTVSAVSAPALQINPLANDLVSVHLTARGESQEEAELQAKREAVLAAAGRVLIEDKLIRADELLVKYINRYAENFVRGVEITNDEFTEGFVVLDTRVFIDYKALIEDLEEKKFLYQPAYKPMFGIFMEERLQGDKIEQEVARKTMENSLRVVGMKPYEGQIESPPVSINVGEDPELLEQAFIAAERRNIELIVTGESNTSLREQKKLYYDEFFFYDCEMRISVYRVDTGEKFFETSGRNSGSAKDRGDAVELAIQRTADNLAESVETAYQGFWPGVVQGKRKFEVLLTATDDELTRITSEYLKRLGSGTVISTRITFDRSAVLTIDTAADRQALLEALRASPYPSLTVVREIGDRKFEVQVAG